MSIEYAIIVKNKTRLEALIERFNTHAQAEFYIKKQGGDFADYVSEHDVFHAALSDLQAKLSGIIKYKIVERKFLPAYIFSPQNMIIVIGQDGLVANTAKYAREIPIVAVNPDKNRNDGVLLPFDNSNFINAVEKVIAGGYKYKTMRFAEAKLNDGQRPVAFNDLFIGAASHVSARYKITYNNKTEDQSSSGIIVATSAGASGWLSSVFNMAYGVVSLFEKGLKPKRPKIREDELLFAVREPFQSVRSQIGIIAGVIKREGILTIESTMPGGGVIFSDGIESDFLHFNSGAVATISIAVESARLVLNA